MTEYVMVLSTFTWIHVSMTLTEITRAPILSALVSFLIQRWTGDTHTHPILGVVVAFVTMQIYRAHGISMHEMPSIRIEWITLFQLCCIAMDIVWSPILGSIVVVCALRAIDFIWITKPRKMAMHKTWCLFPGYMFIVLGMLAKESDTFHKSQLVFALVTTAIGLAYYTVGYVQGQSDWAMDHKKDT